MKLIELEIDYTTHSIEYEYISYHKPYSIISINNIQVVNFKLSFVQHITKLLSNELAINN